MSLVAILEHMDDFACLGGATQGEISDAESVLNLEFSPEYRAYLQAFGVARAGGHELTGLCSSPRLNVVSATRREREDHAGFPQDCYVVEDTGVDGIVVWQSCSGIVYASTPSSDFKVIAGSLEEYLEM